MINKLLGLSGPAQNITPLADAYFYTRRMNTIIDVSRDALALDHSQVFCSGFLETDTEYRMFYTGQSAASILYAPDGQTYENTDQNFLATLPKGDIVHTGWVKQLGTDGRPKPYFQPRGAGFFDRDQVWLRNMYKEGATVHGYYIGHHTTNGFKLGYTSSLNDGDTWSRSGTTPMYTDTDGPSGHIIMVKGIKVGSTYYIFYNYSDPNVTGIQVASSSSPDSGFTRIATGLLSNQNLGYLGHVAYIDGFVYIWTGREFTTGSGLGPSKKIQLYRTTIALTSFENLGVQVQRKGAMELGCGPEFGLFKKTNGNYFMVVGYGKQSFEFAGFGNEQFTGIKVAELNRSDLPIANRPCVFSYPDYVLRHYPLGVDDYVAGRFYETVNDDKGTINSAPVWTTDNNFLDLNGSQAITFPPVTGFNGADFGIKFRVETLLTGTHELFRNNYILVDIESGKPRVRLSSDGVTYQKDFIANVNISKPVGITYVDDHVYYGFIFRNGTIEKIFNDYVPLTAGQITKTVDNALSVVGSGGNVVMGQNATIETRSYSILNAPTDQEFIDLDI